MPSKPQRLRLSEDFADRIARHGLSLREFAQQAAMNYSTLHGLSNPESQPTRRGGGGGMYPKTAWKIANAYAALVGITPEAAFNEIIIACADDATDG